jgi:hypothetical protein
MLMTLSERDAYENARNISDDHILFLYPIHLSTYSLKLVFYGYLRE